MGKPLRVLMVEDSEDDALLLERELRKGGFEPTAARVDTRAGMEAALRGGTWDLILADHAMPHFSSFEALEVLKGLRRDVPCIVVSGTMTEEEVVKVLKAGAHDFIVKGRYLRLVPAVERELLEAAVRHERDEAERARLAGQAQIEYLARYDPLTDLPNRLLFREHLREAMKYRRRDRSVVVHFLDLDDFKHVNDTLGHSVGDRLLRAVGGRLRGCLRAGDILARIGGDEFAVVQADVARPEDAAGLARKLGNVLCQPFRVAGHHLFVSASIGITLCPADGTSGEHLLKNADMAMYQAKKEGRNTFRFFTGELNARMQDRVALEKDLRLALERDELLLYYQPQLDLHSGITIASEALLRWQHPSRGLLAPGEFISVAEDSGLIVPLTSWVLDQACRQHRSWCDAGCNPSRIAVNVSATHLQHADLVGAVEEALYSSGMASEFLEIEITESLMLRDMTRALETLGRLHELGVSVAIDDFGTGYSSLNYLGQLPVNRLKIDRSFVADLYDRPQASSVVDAIISLGHKLGMRVLAEGVENEAQVVHLREQACDEVQGFFYGRPAPPGELTARLPRPGARPGEEHRGDMAALAGPPETDGGGR